MICAEPSRLLAADSSLDIGHAAVRAFDRIALEDDGRGLATIGGHNIRAMLPPRAGLAIPVGVRSRGVPPSPVMMTLRG